MFLSRANRWHFQEATNHLQAIEVANPLAREFITHIIPKSIFEAMANNEILSIVVFAIFFGIGTAAIGGRKDCGFIA